MLNYILFNESTFLNFVHNVCHLLSEQRLQISLSKIYNPFCIEVVMIII